MTTATDRLAQLAADVEAGLLAAEHRYRRARTATALRLHESPSHETPTVRRVRLRLAAAAELADHTVGRLLLPADLDSARPEPGRR